MSSVFSPIARAAKGMFGLFSSKPDPDATSEQKIKAIEKDDDAAILYIETEAAEKTAIKAKLNMKLTNYLNDSRNSIPNESTETPVAAPVVSPAAVAAVAAATTAVANATIDETNNNFELDNTLSKEKPSDKVNASILQEENDDDKKALERKIEESRQAIIEEGQTVTAFREKCVEEAVNQFQEALRTYDIPVTP